MKAKVLLGVPSNGSPCEESAKASWLCSYWHDVTREPSCTEGLNFNPLWTTALNAGMRGLITHFAFIHADVHVCEDEDDLRWIDRLMLEMDKAQVQFISVPNAIKDHRGLTSSGIGNPDNPWNPWRRFTTAELLTMPRTFTAEDIGYGDKFLLHNEALCLFDMRWPGWYVPNPDGTSRTDFNQSERIRLDRGVWVREQDTEDWHFSRKLWEVGARSALTTRIELIHFGRIGFSNKSADGTYRNGDEDTADQWRRGAQNTAPRTAELEPAGVPG